jgi:Glycosyltransferase family 87
MNYRRPREAPGTRERLFVRPLRGLLQWAPGADGRVVLLAAVAIYLGIIAAGRRAWGVDLWPLLGVPSGPSLFFDARNVTAAWECQRLGYDPLYESPCDPRGRPLMYLRPWLLLGVFGLDQSHTVALSVALVGSMLLTFGALVGRVPAGSGIVLAIAVCSPAVMFAIERANMDIALFSLLSVSLLFWREFPGPSRVVSPVLVLLAATAKLYPVFALPAFMVTRSRIAARAALAATAAFSVYALYNHRDVAHVARIATQGQDFSYGARILLAHLYHQVGADRWAGPAAVKQLLALLPLGLIATLITIRLHRRMGGPSPETSVVASSLLAFHVGACIYLGTFALANNFDYRLVYLLLTLPQLAAWVCTPGHRLSALGGATLVMILVLLWVGSLSQRLHLWDELASWAVAGLLFAIVAATVPPLDTVRRTIFGRSTREGPIAAGAS